MLLKLLSSIAMLAMPAMVSAHEYSSNSTACTRTYTVQPEDTCDIIGQKTLTSTYQVMAFNLPRAGPNCYTLENGADLCLGRYGNDCQLVHRCTNSDTCDSIAARFSIPQSLLLDNNPSLDCGQVYDGLVLCVAPGVMRPPPVAALNATISAQKRGLHRRQWMAERGLPVEDDRDLQQRSDSGQGSDEDLLKREAVGAAGHHHSANKFARTQASLL